jgi:hypothetical protein
MPWVLRKEGDTTNPIAPRLYGPGVTTGRVAYYKKTLVGNRTGFIAVLAEGARRDGDEGCEAILKVYYAGNELPEFDTTNGRIWKFRPGAMTDKVTGFLDPIQGAFEFFPTLKWTASGLACIEILLPEELSDGDEEPTKLKVIMLGKRVRDYVVVGNDLVESGFVYATNNSLVALDVCTQDAKMPLTRFHKSFVEDFKPRCAEKIAWEGGNESSAVAAFQAVTNFLLTDDMSKLVKTSSDAWDARAVTASIAAGTKPSRLEVVAGNGTFAIGYSTTSVLSIPEDCVISLQMNLANTLSLKGGGALLANLGAWGVGDTFAIGIDESGAFFCERNSVKYTVALPAVPAAALFGVVLGFHGGAGVDSAKFQPVGTALVPREVERFDACLAFTQTTPVPTALEAVFFRAPGCRWQDVNGRIKVLTNIEVESDVPVLTFSGRDDSSPLIKSNVVDDSISFYRRPAAEKPNFYVWAYRNKDHPTFKQQYVYTDRANLRNADVGLNEAGITPIGVSNQSLADRIGEFQARSISDLDLFYDLTGRLSTYKAAKGDICRLADEIVNLTNASSALVMILEEQFKLASIISKPYKLQAMSPQVYSDTAHGAVTALVATDSTLALTYAKPPVAVSVVLTLDATQLPFGVYAPTINGVVTFANFAGKQRGRVYWKKPGGAFELTDITLYPATGTNTASFKLVGAVAGTHEVRVVTESLLGTSQDFALHATDDIAVLATFPDVVTSVVTSVVWTADYMSARVASILLTFNFQSFSPDITQQRAKVFVTRPGEQEQLFATLTPTPQSFPPVVGQPYRGKIYIPAERTGVHTIRIQTVDLFDNAASAGVTVTKDVQFDVDYNSGWTDALLKPSALSLAYDGDVVTVTFTKSQAVNVKYQLSSSATFASDVREFLNSPFTFRPTSTGTTTYYLRAVDANAHTSDAISAAVTVSNPSAVTAIAAALDGDELRVSFTPAGTLKVKHYIVEELVAAVLQPRATTASPVRFVPVYAQATYQFRITAYDFNNFSTAVTSALFTMPSTADPTAFAIALVADALVETHAVVDTMTYELSTTNASNGSGVYARERSGQYVERGFSLASRTVTRYLRALSKFGIASNFVSVAQNFAALAAPTLTKDTANQRPNSIPVALSAATNPARVVSIVVQIRASGGAWPTSTAQGTAGVQRYNGAEGTVLFEFNPGGAAEMRVAYEDAFTQSISANNPNVDYLWSATLAHTFTQFIGSNIAPTTLDASHLIVGSIGKSLVMDGSFEASSAVWAGGTGTLMDATAFSIVTLADAPDGDKAARLVAGSTTLISKAFAVRPGKTYSFRFSLRHSNGNGTYYLRACYKATKLDFITFTNKDSYQEIEAAVANSTVTSWTLRQGTFTVPAGVYWLSVHVINNASTGTLDVDDIEVRELAEQVDIAAAAIGILQTDFLATNTFNAGSGSVDILTFLKKLGSANFVPSTATGAQTETPTWESALNTTISSTGVVTKTSGVFGWNAGAVTSRAVFIGDCTLEMTFNLNASGNASVVGLHYGAFDGNYANLLFGAQYLSGTLYCYRSGTLHASLVGAFTSVRIRIAAGVVRWYGVSAANVETLVGTYTPASIAYPLHAAVALVSVGDTQNAVKLTGTLCNNTGAKIHWANRVKVAFDANDDISKSGGTTNTWGDSGAASADVIAANQNARVDFVVNSLTDETHMIGFSTSDTDQNYASIGWAVQMHLGTVALYQSGTLLATYGAVSVNDVISCARIGSTFYLLRNGSIITNFSTTSTAALIVDCAIYKQPTTIKSVRLYKVTARPQGVMLDALAGSLEVGDAATIGGVRADALTLRGVSAIGPDLIPRGSDTDVPMIHKMTTFSLAEVDITDELNGQSNDAKVQLLVVAPEPGADSYANFDSVRRARVTVYNHFGDVIKQRVVSYEGGEMILAEIRHSRKYADPATQAVYEIQFKNQYGWSESRFLKAAAVTSTIPTPQSRQASPMELNCQPILATAAAAGTSNQSTIRCAWLAALSSTGNQTVEVQQVGLSLVTWDALSTANASTVNAIAGGNGAIFAAGALYDVRVRKENDNLVSNIVRVRIATDLPQAEVTDEPAPASFAVAFNSSKQPVFTFTQPGTFVNIERRTLSGTVTSFSIASPTTTYTDTTAVADTEYFYRMRNTFTGGYSSDWTEPVLVKIPSHSATDPSNLTATKTQTSPTWTVNLSWLLNGASGAISLEYKLVSGGADASQAAFWASGVTTIALSAGATSYAHTAQTDGTRIAYRVKGATSGYSNIFVVSLQSTKYSDFVVS